ncbi:MAG: hypothetical protein RTU92_13170, partial [Candidatus Thorarchaeota archaeon]
MHTGLNKGTVLSLMMILLFMVSLSYGSPVVSEPTSSTSDSITRLSYNPVQAVPAQTTDNGTFVWWEQSSDSYSDEWEWENRNWLFGPSPTYEVYHESGLPFDFEDTYADIDEEITFNVMVPKSLFTQETYIQNIRINGYLLTPDWNYQVNFEMNWRNESYQPWSVYSSIYNYTDEGPSYPTYPETPFLDLVEPECDFSYDSNAYYVTFVVSFNDAVPLGLYELNLDVSDSDWNSYGSYNRMDYKRTAMAIGLHPDDAYSYTYDGRYTLEKFDLEGNDLYTVTRGDDFIVRFNITGNTPESVEFRFYVPDYIDRIVNVTGYYSVPVTEYGGWVFDEIQKTYVWDPVVEVTVMKDVYGVHSYREPIETGTRFEYTYRWLNETSLEVESWQSSTNKEYVVKWNQSTDSFDYFLYYSWCTYPFEVYNPGWGMYSQCYEVLEPLVDIPLFYELNLSLSSAQTIGQDFVVDFGGHFNDIMPVTRDYPLRIEEQVYGGPDYWYSAEGWYMEEGSGARQTHDEYELAKDISIETPVTIANLLLEDGTSSGGWIFSAEKGENFMVKASLEGGALIADDIDAVSMDLNAWDGYWSGDEERWSDLHYKITYRLDGTVILDAFNMTQKRNYTYGLYEDYIYTNFTEWYQEYNETTMTWEWDYGEHWRWAWTQVYGWHWEWWYYNQADEVWQTEGIHWEGPNSRIDSDFAVVSGLNNWTVDDDLYVTFLVNMNEVAPDTEYWWDFSFMNDTWHVDYTSDYGDHTALSWAREWVYSFDDPISSDPVYMDPVIENQLAFYNAVLTGAEGSDYLYGKESPYIVIDDVKYPIKVREFFDP